MKALQFTANIPRYLVSRAVRPLFPPICWSRVSCLRYADVPEPRLPGPDWVRVQVRYAGICGSDLHLILLHNSPITSALTSFPFVVGHESVGIVVEAGPAAADIAPGTRVVVEPILPCATRGIDPPCPACQRGDRNQCSHFADGRLSPGLLIGACQDTGGTWSRSFVAHRSQVLRVPTVVSDENAVLVEPFASALHPILRSFPADDETVLIVGGGVIGVCAIAALRAQGSRCRIVALVNHRHQGELAARFGADVVVTRRGSSGHDDELVRTLGARSRPAVMGPPLLIGGADRTFDCAGSRSSVEESLRFTRAGGRVVLVGLAGVLPGVDWTPIWLKELDIRGSFAYADEQADGRRIATCQLALDLLADRRVDLGSLVTHRYPLAAYERAFDVVARKRRSGVVKAVFAFDE
ncbi:MAG: alcohol dehydrogenase catalytic domain-containing protein [Chloroflexi bacterium]|nr:alcohol dehydrogenase catalytic domain-containing protein [Chloroflexota bacterium]